MRSYIKELKREKNFDFYHITAEEAFAEMEEKIEIQQTFNTFVVPDQEIPESIVGEDKASFVTYNGVPYNKQN